ncbi:hypothetical protein CEXT_431771 [Caerostris extrusa]|uniref:Uncharacterized protein n=1 Tax=Caerostris extrusa TaxID=172846 RepID=A0AAV4T1X9_CAEEX|nr:hypothetical protein CEXT_431771 [Caerostris extrusa]
MSLENLYTTLQIVGATKTKRTFTNSLLQCQSHRMTPELLFLIKRLRPFVRQFRGRQMDSCRTHCPIMGPTHAIELNIHKINSSPGARATKTGP